MSWFREGPAFRRLTRLAIVLASAGLVAGCFEPLYGERTLTGGPGLRDHLSSIDVAQIDAANGTPEARLAVVIRNTLLFDLTGGHGGASPTHQLVIKLRSTKQSVIVDVTSARPDIENYGIDANYTLVELATGKTVMSATTFARVSYDIPGGEQRFARARGLRDAESRAAKGIAESIKARLASYLVAGT
jgi:LPS-assembly lipoprotein